MSKKSKITSSNLEKTIMAKVKSNEISMKPRWYFIAGSLLMLAGLAGFSVIAVFLTNLTIFLLRRHGPMGEMRFQQLISSFPIWVPLLAIIGTMLGLIMLKKYDFSYKRNFWVIVAGFIISIILAAFAMDFLGLNDIWSRRGPMRRFYQQMDGKYPTPLQGQRQGRLHR